MFEAGLERMVCKSDIKRSGLTVVDMRDAWAPSLLGGDNDDELPAFRATYLQIATEHDSQGRELAPLDALSEQYGVTPSFAVVRSRLADTRRHTCHADAKGNVRRILVCEGFLDGDTKLATGLELFQRRHFLVPTGKLDRETQETLDLDSRELDYRLALRILRERVADAAGLIEDGTAGAGPVEIMGRQLEPKAYRTARGHQDSLPFAAVDLIGVATDAAAKALGWTDADAVQAFFEAHPQGIRAAFALPPVPAYHSKHMALSVEVDRGDVYYDEEPKRRGGGKRPTITLYVDDNGTLRPLVRWPTTIGGWSEVTDEAGNVKEVWKESDVGPRVWRKLYAAPTWLPPESTPDKDLVAKLPNGTYELKTTVMGPGPRAAYGMMMLQHEKDLGDGKWWTNSIGTHGSANVASVQGGTSHGCHRLYNLQAVRLGSFLLKHRKHDVKGEERIDWNRKVDIGDQHFEAQVDSRGFLYELTPPVPVTVTEGTIKTARREPSTRSAPASE